MLSICARRNQARSDRVDAAYRRAAEICEEDIAVNRAMGRHGVALIEAIAAKKAGEPLNLLTHCNAGWLATVDLGTATAPIYLAHDRGLQVHVWVDETRPRNQGASLTAWELGQHGVPHTVIRDNTGGHLMQHAMVDMAIVGCPYRKPNGMSSRSPRSIFGRPALFRDFQCQNVLKPARCQRRMVSG